MSETAMNDITGGVESVSIVATAAASKYLQQLCKHFSHKRPTTFDAQSGHIAFDDGDCYLEAAAGQLLMTVTAPDEARNEVLRGVIDRHLQRFAFREELAVDWRVV
ncbi:DUF2218 domain-containing protein [Aestuariispira ectoiniformans]|uniref:DUF2218 domain-containing protein n=1 Tax=Aestuariispira ectoiniformans TaxID=2775080 RepID=UPI00223B6A1C|nr:DUF2218 domain-containing protein [Aestuariispira ectoiniformans]